MDNFFIFEELFSDSDDEESDLILGNVLFFYFNNNHQNWIGPGIRTIPRIQNYIETVIVNYNIEEFKNTFRYVKIRFYSCKSM